MWINKVLNVQERRVPILFTIVEVKFNQKLVEWSVAEITLKRSEVENCGSENWGDSYVPVDVETVKFEVSERFYL